MAGVHREPRSAGPRWASKSALLGTSALIRSGLILFGRWQDANFEVKYTDIDYEVFTDAAAFMADGGSPYDRATFRYPPLLALLLVPNVAFREWGKVLFASADLAVGWMLYEHGARLDARAGRTTTSHRQSNYKLICAAMWLFNPYTMTVSTRGNGEALVILILLLQCQAVLSGQMVGAGLLYGLVVYWRIFPAVYAVSTILFIVQGAGWAAMVQLLKFGGSAAATFLLLMTMSFAVYGEDFLENAILYHLSRLDHRHNFSPFFYHIYLSWDEATLLNRAALLPQALVNYSLAAAFYRDLPFCWVLQTVAFVAINKVSTAQYFVWYFGILPLSIPSLQIAGNRILGVAFSIWLLCQVNWLAWAYLLEFKGLAVYLHVWTSSCLFFLANICLLLALMQAHWKGRQRVELVKRE